MTGQEKDDLLIQVIA